MWSGLNLPILASFISTVKNNINLLIWTPLADNCVGSYYAVLRNISSFAFNEVAQKLYYSLLTVFSSRFLFNPSACLDEHLMQFKFLGILMGVAIRTKKPLDLHLAPMVWKQLCCIPLILEDLEEVDLLYVQTLNSILHIEDSGITEENFHEVRCKSWNF